MSHSRLAFTLLSTTAILAVAHRASVHRSHPLQEAKRIELAVQMHCASCENQVRSILSKIPGVSSIQLDLDSQTAVVTGESLSESQVLSKLTFEGRVARIIGLGATHSVVPKEVGSDDEWSAAVAEFKGDIYGHGSVVGVLRMVQLSSDSASIEWDLDGLAANKPIRLNIHKSGDTRNGPASTGGPLAAGGNLGQAVSDGKGHAQFRQNLVGLLPVWDVIGRAVVVSQDDKHLAAAVLARSAGVGANSGKRLCTCSGTTIWESSSQVL